MVEKMNMAQQRIDLTGQLNEARIAKMQAGGGNQATATLRADKESRIQVQALIGNVAREITANKAETKALGYSVPTNDPRRTNLAAEHGALTARLQALNEEALSTAATSRPNLAPLKKPAAQTKTTKSFAELWK